MHNELPPILRYHHESRGRRLFDLEPHTADVTGVIVRMDADAQAMGYDEFFGQLIDQTGFDEETGLHYAVLTGGDRERVSAKRAIALHAALGISMEEMLPIAELIRRISDTVGLADEEGKPLGVVVTGTPDHDFKKRLHKPEKHDLLRGDLGVIGRKNLQLINRLMPRPEGADPVELIVIGYSLGTANGIASTEYATEFGLHVVSLVAGAPPNVETRRDKAQLFSSFVVEGLRGSYAKGTPKVFTHTSASKGQYWRDVIDSASFYLDVLSAVSQKSAATSIVRGYRANSNGTGMHVNIGSGTRDKVSRYESILDMLRALGPELGTDLEALFAVDLHHGLGRNPRVLGGLVAFALDRVAAQGREPKH